MILLAIDEKQFNKAKLIAKGKILLKHQMSCCSSPKMKTASSFRSLLNLELDIGHFIC